MHICAKTNSNRSVPPKACFLSELNKATKLSINNEHTFDFKCITKIEKDNAPNEIALWANEYTFTITEIKNAMKIGDSWYITRTFGIQEFEYQISSYQ